MPAYKAQYRVRQENVRTTGGDYVRVTSSEDGVAITSARFEEAPRMFNTVTGEYGRRIHLMTSIVEDPQAPDCLLCTVEEFKHPPPNLGRRSSLGVHVLGNGDKLSDRQPEEGLQITGQSYHRQRPFKVTKA